MALCVYVGGKCPIVCDSLRLSPFYMEVSIVRVGYKLPSSIIYFVYHGFVFLGEMDQEIKEIILPISEDGEIGWVI